MSLTIKKFKCHIKSMAPLLMDRFPSEEWQEGSPLPEANKLKTMKDYKKSYERSKYLTKKNKLLYTPSSHVLGSLIKAGAKVPLTSRARYANMLKEGAFVYPEKIIHIKQKCEMDVRNAVNNNCFPPAAIMTCRARLEEWELQFDLHCWDNRATKDGLLQCLKLAGMYKGIGAYRPRYGRFEVLEFRPFTKQELEEDEKKLKEVKKK